MRSPEKFFNHRCHRGSQSDFKLLSTHNSQLVTCSFFVFLSPLCNSVLSVVNYLRSLKIIMPRAFISVGSNIRPRENVRKALRILSRFVRITGISTVYRTPDEKRPRQPDYYNCVIEAETNLGPKELKFARLRGIEALLGRRRGRDKSAPRTMDLDLILYGDKKIKSGDMVLPDRQIGKRPYLGLALRELAPGLKLPGGGPGIDAVVAAAPAGGLPHLRGYTRRLRKEVLDGDGCK